MKKTVMALVLLCQVMMACGQQKAKQTAPQGGDDFATKMENTIAQYNALESEAEQLLKGEENDETFDRLVALGQIADSLSRYRSTCCSTCQRKHACRRLRPSIYRSSCITWTTTK